MVKSFLLLSCLIITLITAKGQSQQTTSTAAQQYAIGLYAKNIDRGSRLYNGTEYAFYHPLKGEYPYLYEAWKEGAVAYDGQLFTDLKLLYDISTDQVVVKYAAGGNAQLIKPLVDFFTLDERKFVKVDDSLHHHGFYEILFDGKIKVYAKHEKAMREYIVDRELHREFDEKTFRLLLKDGVFVEVKSKKMLLQIFADHAPELKRFMREKKLKFKSADFDKSLVQAVAYYEQI